MAIIFAEFSGGGTNNSRNTIINQILNAVGGKNELLELKDKVLYNSFFQLEGDYYIYVRFSKNNLFQTMVEVPFIVQLENPKDEQQFIETYTKKAQKVADFIQQQLSQMASNPQPQQSRSLFRRLRNGTTKTVVNPIASKIIAQINQKLKEYENTYNDDNNPPTISIFA